MKLPRYVIRKINRDFSIISHSISGGMDSLYSLLNLLNDPYLKTPIQPQFNNTGLNLKSAKEVIEKVNSLCPGHELLKPVKVIHFHSFLDGTRFEGQKAIDIVKDSFQYIEKAERLLLEGKYSKKVFPCCYFLKDRPLVHYARTTSSDTLFTRSIRPGESMQRNFYLSKIRNEGRYFNFDKKIQRWVFYPLRDTKFKDVQKYLLNHGLFWNTKHSGCSICPVLKLFDFKR